MAEMWDYILYSMNAPFGRTRVTRGWNRDLVLYDHTFSNLFQPLIGTQEPPLYAVVPVIKMSVSRYQGNGRVYARRLPALRQFLCFLPVLGRRQGSLHAVKTHRCVNRRPARPQ